MNTSANTSSLSFSAAAVASSCQDEEDAGSSPAARRKNDRDENKYNTNLEDGKKSADNNLDCTQNNSKNKTIEGTQPHGIHQLTPQEEETQQQNVTTMSVDGRRQQLTQAQRQSSRSLQPPDHEDYNIVASLPRLVQRNLPFHQSRNNIQIENYRDFATITKNNKNETNNNNYLNNLFSSSRYELFRLLKSDWFHILLRAPVLTSLFVLITIWTVMIIIFASIYYAFDQRNVDKACGLTPAGETIPFGGAFAFALETCTTVGYGLPSSVNSFFEAGCSNLQIIIYFQMIWSMMFNAFLFAFFYSQLAKCDSRGAQVIFSNKAIINIDHNTKGRPQVRFQLRIYDVDSKTPIVEAHVRVYAVLKDRPVPRQLRLIQPDDELNGMVFLSVPTVICHHIDLYSMLHPPAPPTSEEWLKDLLNHSNNHKSAASESTTTNEPILLLPYRTSTNGLPAIRQIDSWTGGHDQVVCPVCGESYGTVDRWIQHVLSFQTSELVNDYPILGTHLSINNDVAFQYARTYLQPTTDLVAIQRYFQENISEIIVVVEGIEPTSSGTFAALQSYCVEDIVFDAKACFRPCLSAVNDMTSETKATSKDDSSTMIVDLDRFHGIDFNVIAPDAEDLAEVDTSSTSIPNISTDSNKTGNMVPSWKSNLDTIAASHPNPSSSTASPKVRLRSHSYRHHDKIFS